MSGCLMNKKKRNKNILITGASQGLGFELSKKFISIGYDISICSRKINNLKKIRLILQRYKKNAKQKILISKCDVSDEKQVKNFIQRTKKEFKNIDVIINNAGIYGPKGSFEKQDFKKWESAFKINFFGSLFVFKNIIPIFKKQKFGKIIQISGGGATNPLPNFSSYAASKAAIIRFAETLSEELKNYRIDINSVAPGFLPTQFHQEVLKAGPNSVGINFFNKTLKQLNVSDDNFKKPLDLCVFLASSKSNGITGKLISANWDRWQIFKTHLMKVKNTDVFTLRRIVGKDRNLSILDG